MDILDISVLYVEDADIIRKASADIIRKRVTTLYVAADGQEGLELYKQHRPDIVITDIGMPKMDGLEMSRAIKAINPDIKIIITTAHDDSKYLLSSIEIGIDQYILKSEIKTQIINAVNKWYEQIILEKRAKAESDFVYKLSKIIIDESPTLIVVANPHHIIEFVNKHFMEVTGYSPEEIVGRKPSILKSGAHPDEFYRELNSTIESGNKWSGTFINKKKNGELFNEQAVIFPVKSAGGELLYYIKTGYLRPGDSESGSAGKTRAAKYLGFEPHSKTEEELFERFLNELNPGTAKLSLTIE